MSASLQQIKAIHAEARRVGFDEEMRRAFMRREVGKESCKQMNEAQAKRVILSLKRLGGKNPARRSRASVVSGKYAGLLRAMWLNAYHLGVVKNRDDKALIAFAKRQTGVDHTQFLTRGSDVNKVVEALKAMMTHEVGVDWTDLPRNPRERTEAMQRRVLRAQRRLLGIFEGEQEAWRAEGPTGKAKNVPAERLNDEIARLGTLVRKKRGVWK